MSIIEKSYDDNTKTITFTLPKQGFLNFDIKPVDQSLIPADGISFYIVRLGKVIVVHPQSEFFIGRSVDDTWTPQVNFTEADGSANSVSRRHAMIRPLKRGYDIIDLHSTNGTLLNDYRLVPDKAYPLISGAQLSIGRELVIVIFSSTNL